ncbi:hypothetical protein [Virgibacillus halodenitrificans]|uniref:hypothetical protein n=1 Tax=Virgibacillus halodenitrificans TaxID=1482 RepID=UPI000761AADB
MSKGWIKLYRDIKDHWIYQESRKFSKYEAWLDMLMSANYKDNKFVLGNELIEVKRGQFVTSIRRLCNEWDWSNTKVVQFLELLQKDGMIEVTKDTKKTVITIIKYDIYQTSNDTEKTENTHEDDTEQIQKHTNKKVKNENKKEEEINNERPNNIAYEILQDYLIEREIDQQTINQTIRELMNRNIDLFLMDNVEKQFEHMMEKLNYGEVDNHNGFPVYFANGLQMRSIQSNASRNYQKEKLREYEIAMLEKRERDTSFYYNWLDA